jgi:uncharacterized protein HemY
MRNISRLREKHLALLEERQATPLSHQVLPKVQQFLDELQQATQRLSNEGDYRTIEGLTAYWSDFIFEKTDEYPAIRLAHPSLVELCEVVRTGADQAIFRFADEHQTKVTFTVPAAPSDDPIVHQTILQRLQGWLSQGTAAILHGSPGVGKTTLALRVSNSPQVLRRYPDGVLWASLGSAPDVFALLGGWCQALGLPAAEIAALTTISSRVEAIRTAIGLGRMLIAVDDIWTAEDALPFLPGAPNCSYLLATYDPEVAGALSLRLETYVCPSSPHRPQVVEVPELDRTEGRRLMQRILPQLPSKYLRVVNTLIDQVSGSLMALLLIAKNAVVDAPGGEGPYLQAFVSLLASRTTASPGITDRETAQASRTEPAAVVSAVIQALYERLDPTSQEALRALALFPPKPNIFSEDAAHRVVGEGLNQVRPLEARGFIEVVPGARHGESAAYSMHRAITDLLRSAATADPGGHEQARERMVRYYADFVDQVVDPRSLVNGAVRLEQQYEALAREHRNITGALRLAAAADSDTLHLLYVRGVHSLYDYLEIRGLYEEAKELLERGREIARTLNAPAEQACLLLDLGQVLEKCAAYSQAEAYLGAALPLAQEAAAVNLLCRLYLNLGVVATARSNYPTAAAYLSQGLELADKHADYRIAGDLRLRLSIVECTRGELDEAEANSRRALNIAREIRARSLECAAMLSLGVIAFQRATGLEAEIAEANQESTASGSRTRLDDHLLQAEDWDVRALALAREDRDCEHICASLQALGGLAIIRRRFKQAEALLEESLGLARRIGHRWYECIILKEWGELHLAQQKFGLAAACFREALGVADQVRRSDPGSGALADIEGFARYGLSRVAAGLQDAPQARTLAEQSHALFADSGHVMARETERWRRSIGAPELTGVH